MKKSLQVRKLSNKPIISGETPLQDIDDYFDWKIIQKTKTLQLAREIRNQVQLAGLILCLVYLKANTYILC